MMTDSTTQMTPEQVDAAVAKAQAAAEAAQKAAEVAAAAQAALDAQNALSETAADAEIVEVSAELVPDNAVTMDDVLATEVAAPSLTLDPASTDTAIAVASEAVSGLAAKTATLESSLSSTELAQVDSFTKQIDITNHAQMMSFGSQPQKKMANFSGDVLSKIHTKDMDQAGDMITDVLAELKELNLGDEKKKGILGFFRKQKNKLEMVKAQYDSIEKNVDKIAADLEGRQLALVKDSAMLEKLYELNLTYFKELTMYLVAGRKKVDEVRKNELAEAVAKAKETGATEDAEAVQKLTTAIDRFEKKLTDLDLSRTVSMQMAPQIRFVQNNENLMIEKIQTTLTNTIPMWKNQMIFAVGLDTTEKALKAEKEVTDMTNRLLRENSERLRQSTVAIARESERGVIDIETLRTANENLMSTFDEMLQIQAEGRAKRAETEIELRRMEAELKKKLVDVATVQLPGEGGNSPKLHP